MAKAAVDLPDPLDQPTSAAGADDLLAQLAGDEIDRLLTEAHVEREPAAKPELAAAAPSTPREAPVAAPAELNKAETSQITAELDEQFEQMAGPVSDEETAATASEIQPASSAADAPADTAAPAQPASDSVGDLLSKISETDTRKQAQTPAAAPSEPQPALSVAGAASTTDLETTAAERDGLGVAGPLEIAEPSPENSAHDEPAEATAPPAPLWLRILQVLNAPLSGSDVLRDACGKIAVLTLLNAIGILIYVLFVRR